MLYDVAVMSKNPYQFDATERHSEILETGIDGDLQNAASIAVEIIEHAWGDTGAVRTPGTDPN